MSKNSFFNRSRCFFPKASAKVRTFCGLAKYLANFFASNTLFWRLDDCGQRGTPFIYLRARKKEQKTINKGERGRGEGEGRRGENDAGGKGTTRDGEAEPRRTNERGEMSARSRGCECAVAGAKVRGFFYIFFL